jgi:hypothetical protein
MKRDEVQIKNQIAALQNAANCSVPFAEVKEIVERYKFANTATENPPFEVESPYDFVKKYFNGGYWGQQANLMKTGFYKQSGWAYDFRPFLKKFLYKQDGTWTEVYAPNRTLLNKSIHGKIDKIVEIE